MKLLAQAAFLISSFFALYIFSSFQVKEQKLFSLTVETTDLRNNEGSVVFALYNRDDAFPDQHYKKYYKKMVGKIVNHIASVTFKDLPTGKYAVNILHDEDNNSEIKKGFIYPKKGLDFQITNRLASGISPILRRLYSCCKVI